MQQTLRRIGEKACQRVATLLRLPWRALDSRLRLPSPCWSMVAASATMFSMGLMIGSGAGVAAEWTPVHYAGLFGLLGGMGMMIHAFKLREEEETE